MRPCPPSHPAPCTHRYAAHACCAVQPIRPILLLTHAMAQTGSPPALLPALCPVRTPCMTCTPTVPAPGTPCPRVRLLCWPAPAPAHQSSATRSSQARSAPRIQVHECPSHPPSPSMSSTAVHIHTRPAIHPACHHGCTALVGSTCLRIAGVWCLLPIDPLVLTCPRHCSQYRHAHQHQHRPASILHPSTCTQPPGAQTAPPARTVLQPSLHTRPSLLARASKMHSTPSPHPAMHPACLGRDSMASATGPSLCFSPVSPVVASMHCRTSTLPPTLCPAVCWHIPMPCSLWLGVLSPQFHTQHTCTKRTMPVTQSLSACCSTPSSALLHIPSPDPVHPSTCLVCRPHTTHRPIQPHLTMPSSTMPHSTTPLQGLGA